MNKNKYWKLKTPCAKCSSRVVYNQTHKLRFCKCTPPEHVKINETELERDWVKIKDQSETNPFN